MMVAHKEKLMLITTLSIDVAASKGPQENVIEINQSQESLEEAQKRKSKRNCILVQDDMNTTVYTWCGPKEQETLHASALAPSSASMISSFEKALFAVNV